MTDDVARDLAVAALPGVPITVVGNPYLDEIAVSAQRRGVRPTEREQARNVLLVPEPTSAHAQAPDITLNTPQIQQIQARMSQRFQGQLAPHFASGALGFGRDGMIVVRDAAALGLRDRAAVPALVAEDNRDRAAVYREIAVANGHPEWEPQVRETFARQWVQSARAGWWYQDASGAWKQK